MSNRHQHGWVTRVKRAAGPTWLFKFHVTRISDGKRVQNHHTIGLVSDFPSESQAWGEVERRGLNGAINKVVGQATFGQIAAAYMERRLGANSTLAHGTRERIRSIITNRLLPRFSDNPAEAITPLELEDFLLELRTDAALGWNTLQKIKVTAGLVFKHGEKYFSLPKNPVKLVELKSGSDYEALILTPAQTAALIDHLPDTEKPLAWLVAATGLRISEALGLMWTDINWREGLIQLKRKWGAEGIVPKLKTKRSRSAVAMHPILARILQEWRKTTPYSGDNHFLFPSFRLSGKQPRTANMIVEDYLRPAAVAAGVLAADDTTTRFGFHNLRHSLSSFLISSGADPRTVMDSLRHSSLKTTLELYSQSVDTNRRKAQGKVLRAIAGGAKR